MGFHYPKGGFITAFYDPLKVPNAPTIGAATAGDAQAIVTFTAPTNVGGSAITGYTAISTPGEFEGTGTSSPITVTGLSNDTAYTFQVWATNSYGPSAYSAASGSVTPALQRGLFGGGATSGFVANNTIDYVSIVTLSNATDFGDLTVARATLAACSSATRGVFGGGDSGSYSNVLDYVTISSEGNATDFGDLLNSVPDIAACSSSTRGIFGGMYRITTNNIQYITIASTGNATGFGNLTVNFFNRCSFASPTRGVFAGGQGDDFNTSGYTNVIDYITIATTGNATDFGDISSQIRTGLGNCSSDTRGIIAGGADASATTNVIEYVTIATTGNATDFGDLTGPQQQMAGTSSLTRGIFGGGSNSSNVIQYITIASIGNSIDFGDLSVSRYYAGACSNCHGGLA